MRQQPELLEARELVADRRRSPLDLPASSLRAHGRPAVEVLLDDLPQHELLPTVNTTFDSRSAAGPSQ